MLIGKRHGISHAIPHLTQQIDLSTERGTPETGTYLEELIIPLAQRNLNLSQVAEGGTTELNLDTVIGENPSMSFHVPDGPFHNLWYSSFRE